MGVTIKCGNLGNRVFASSASAGAKLARQATSNLCSLCFCSALECKEKICNYLHVCTLPSYCTDRFSAVVFTERLTIFERLCKHLYMERGSGDHVINRDISPPRDLDHHLEIRAEPFYAPATSSLLTLTEHLQYRNLREGIG